MQKKMRQTFIHVMGNRIASKGNCTTDEDIYLNDLDPNCEMIKNKDNQDSYEGLSNNNNEKSLIKEAMALLLLLMTLQICIVKMTNRKKG